jgi:hypothetical protein
MREFKVGDKVKCDFFGDGVIKKIEPFCSTPLYVHFETSRGWWYNMNGQMVGMETHKKLHITLIEEEKIRDAQKIKENNKEEVVNKFNVGDKVWDMRTMEIGEVIKIDSDNDVIVKYKEGFGFYNINGKVSNNDFIPTIRLIGEDIIIKSPVLPEPPQRTFKDIIEDINKCRKEFVVGEDNYVIQLVHSRGENIDGILTSPYTFVQSQCKYYSEDVDVFVKEIRELNFLKEFAGWFNGGCLSEEFEPAVKESVVKNKYIELTGREDTGTVGYVGEYLVQVVDDGDEADPCSACDLFALDSCADYCLDKHFKLYND